PPSERGVVVVGAGVDHAIFGHAMRKINMRAGVAESELQDGHAGNFVVLPQGVNVGGDVAEIFGEERQAAKFLAQLDEEIVARSIDPASAHGRGIAGGNLPELGEAAEMIEADVVAGVRGPTEPLDPPAIAAG